MTATLPAVERVPVPFRGDGAGTGPLTWGQIGIWQAIAGSGESRTMGGSTSIAGLGLTVADLTDLLAYVMRRHPALRTRLFLRAGADPLQVCSAAGEVPLEVVDAGSADPAEVAAALEERYAAVPFDYEHEWPVRMGVVRVGTELTHMVAVYLHLSMDAGGLAALIADMAARDPATGEGPDLDAVAPLEQAAQQQRPAALRQSAAALRHFERVLRTAPASRFGPPRHTDPRPYRMIRYRSPATRLAVDAVARRSGVSTSAVLLACFAVGLARVTGSNPVLAMLMVGNRFRPGFARSVSTLVQISPYLIDVGDTTVAEAVARAARSTMNAYKHAYYDPNHQDEVLARVNGELGTPFDYSCFYNDRRAADRVAEDAPDPTPEQIAAALARSEVHWEDEPGMPRQKLYLHLDDPVDPVTGEVVVDFALSVDTRYFTAADTEAVVRAIEAAAVQAHTDPGARTGVPATPAEHPGQAPEEVSA